MTSSTDGFLAHLPGGRVRVLDFSSGIAGAYCTKLLADAGADVVKVEPAGGDALRRWSSTDAPVVGDGALFQFLAASKRSITGSIDDPSLRAAVACADMVVEDAEIGCMEDAGFLHMEGLVVVSISPYGRVGPWSGRPSSDLVVQAESGCISGRGLPEREPFSLGGRVFDFVAGGYAATAGLAAVISSRRHGRGEHVDVSVLEAAAVGSFSPYVDLDADLEGLRPDHSLAPPQWVESPSIEPTLDGWVGFTTNSRQQYQDFVTLIDRIDLIDDERFATARARRAHLEEWTSIVEEWTTRHRTDEIIERAARLRIPVAPVGNAATVTGFAQFVERGVFVPNPSGGFLQPRCPYRIGGIDPPAPGAVPGAGEHSGSLGWSAPPLRGTGPFSLPLDGVRVLDMTTWFAGPLGAQLLGILGADVVHLESITRIDGMRTTGGAHADRFADWWECSPQFMAINSDKRGLTLDLQQETGLTVLRALLAGADVLIENFTPRVLDNFGLTWDVVHEVNPQLTMVRMPAFGLSGPWREWTGFAQTMEQVTGLAWVTGHVDDQPRIQRGPCDILSGAHAAFATILALVHRESTGTGHHVESTMVEAALNAAAEQIVEYGAYGHLMQREGNRTPWAAPQGLYPGSDGRWVALSVSTDAEWKSLCDALCDPILAGDQRLATRAGRRGRQEELDVALRAWAGQRSSAEAVDTLLAHRVPAGVVFDQRFLHTHEQLAARGFFEEMHHPSVGRRLVAGPPFRYSSIDRWLTRPAPTLGQHNRDVLRELVGLSPSEIRSLQAQQVIGERPAGV